MKTLSWMASILIFALFAIVALPSQEIGAVDESEVADHMHEHLTRITTIKSSVIMGNLDGVREPATWLVEHETVSGLPENFEPYVEMIRSYARELVAAPDLKSAAKSVSRMAQSCGNCLNWSSASTRNRRNGRTPFRSCNAISGRPTVCGRA